MMRFSKNVLLILLMTLLICCTSAAQAAYSRADFPPVLMYHDVRETAPIGSHTCTHAHLEQIDSKKRREEKNSFALGKSWRN